MHGVKLSTLVVLCSRRGISLRKGGPQPKRTNLTLPDEPPLSLSDGVLKSLREATRAMGKDSAARVLARSACNIQVLSMKSSYGTASTL
jgi:hypothetical protein